MLYFIISVFATLSMLVNIDCTFLTSLVIFDMYSKVHLCDICDAEFWVGLPRELPYVDDWLQ